MKTFPRSFFAFAPIFAGATRPDEERPPEIRKPSECADAFINRKVYAKPPMPIRKRPHKRGHSLYCSRHRIKNWRFFRSKQQQMLLRYFRCKYKKRFRYIQQVSGNGTIFDIFISVCLIRRRLPASPHGPRPAPVHSGQTPAVHARLPFLPFLPFPAACVGGGSVRIASSDARREADPVRRPHKRERVVRPNSAPPWKTAQSEKEPEEPMCQKKRLPDMFQTASRKTAPARTRIVLLYGR